MSGDPEFYCERDTAGGGMCPLQCRKCKHQVAGANVDHARSEFTTPVIPRLELKVGGVTLWSSDAFHLLLVDSLRGRAHGAPPAGMELELTVSHHGQVAIFPFTVPDLGEPE